MVDEESVEEPDLGALQREVAELDQQLTEKKQLLQAVAEAQLQPSPRSARLEQAARLRNREQLKDLICWNLQANGMPPEAIAGHTAEIERVACSSVHCCDPEASKPRLRRIKGALASDEGLELARTIRPRPRRPASAIGQRSVPMQQTAKLQETAGARMTYEQGKTIFISRLRGIILQDREAARDIFKQYSTGSGRLDAGGLVELLKDMSGESVTEAEALQLIGTLGAQTTISFEQFINRALGMPEDFYEADLSQKDKAQSKARRAVPTLPANTPFEHIKSTLASKMRSKLFRIDNALHRVLGKTPSSAHADIDTLWHIFNREIGFMLNKHELDQLFRHLDRDADGKVNLVELRS